MNMSRWKRAPARHPAVIDLLDAAPVSVGAGTSGEAAAGPGGRGKKAVVLLGAAAAVAVTAVTSAVLLGGGSGTGAPSHPAPTGAPQHGVSSLPLLPVESAVESAAEQEDSIPGQCHAERGDQGSGAGVIAAFNFAYYSLRNGEAARALATPTTSVLPAPQLQTYIDGIPVGTTYCQKITEVSAEVYLVALTVRRPGEPVETIVQTVSTQKLDGRWFVDVFA